MIVDMRTADIHIKHHHLMIDFDLQDIPRDRIMLAEAAWSLCRAGKLNPARVGSRYYRGLWCVRNNLLQAFAFLNKKELLIWDVWGLMRRLPTEKISVVPVSQLALFDQLSRYLLTKPDAVSLQSYYQSHPLFQVPNNMLVCNPLCTPRESEVRL